jgi:hypothetical protein
MGENVGPLPNGHVTRLRQNWSVFEDGALAERLQSEEINTHLSGNRQRNHQIREDLPHALEEQSREVETACKVAEERRRILHDIESRDAEVAKQVQSRLFATSRSTPPLPSGTPPLPVMANGDVPTDADVLPNRRGRIVYNDEQYQVKMARPALVKDEPLYANNKPEHYAVSTKYPGGTPTGAISKIPAVSPRRMMMMHQQHQDESNLVGMAGLSQRDVVLSKRAEDLLAQERNDEELAKRLQEQLAMEGDEDAKYAREAQDREYAKMLHAKEKAKLKRAKERSRQKKLAAQQQQDPESLGATRADSRISKHSSRHSNGHTPQRSFDNTENNLNNNDDDEEDVEDDDDESVISAPTIQLPARRPFMNTGAIDSHKSEFATYLTGGNDENEEDLLTEPQYANVGRNADGVVQQYQYQAQAAAPVAAMAIDGIPVPPYMPMQQPMSKKSSSLEKKIKKKKEKEGCKQQ